MSDSRLFQPVTIGAMQLLHRVAIAPMTRLRASDQYVPLPIMTTYYSQRACIPGTLLISEATYISAEAGGYDNVPAIYANEQFKAWQEITNAVHARGSYIYCQLWALGRAAREAVAVKEGFTVKAPSDVGLVQDFATAAKQAIEAGFDAVEIHGANGYLVDQFIQSTANQRSDEYGGSIENRSRFTLEVLTTVIGAIGSDKTALRLSPFGNALEIRMEDTIPQFSDLIRKANRLGLAYLHLVNPRASGDGDGVGQSSESLDFAIELWDGPLLLAGALDSGSAKKLVELDHPTRDIVASFGRPFISNPDLVYKIENGLGFAPYDRNTFYLRKSPQGYIDYPLSEEVDALL
ncbi:hypothetical protein NW754_003869 [Fusarium falciforme]|nr:hypothetical protein NW754_003869 [Fusarium falciforme]